MKVSHSPVFGRLQGLASHVVSYMGFLRVSNKVGLGKPVKTINNSKMYLLLNMVIYYIVMLVYCRVHGRPWKTRKK